MDKFINTTNNTTYSFGAKIIAEALKETGAEQLAKAEKAKKRTSRAARQEKAAELGVKIVTPVTSAASAKFVAAEEIRRDFEVARKAAKAAAYAERQRIAAEEDAIDAALEKAEKEAENFGKNIMAIAMAKALAAKGK